MTTRNAPDLTACLMAGTRRDVATRECGGGHARRSYWRGRRGGGRPCTAELPSFFPPVTSCARGERRARGAGRHPCDVGALAEAGRGANCRVK